MEYIARVAKQLVIQFFTLNLAALFKQLVAIF
jgi:hypothetical protein